MSDEQEFDPRRFTYRSPWRDPPVEGELYERPDCEFLAEVPQRPLIWLWRDRIPWNKLTLIEGPAESGKSLLAIDLAARASRGEPLPGDANEKFREFRVLIASGHDDVHDTIIPRLKRAGGAIDQLCRISRIERSLGDEEPFAKRRMQLPRDLLYFEESISDAAADIVIVDPLSHFCQTRQATVSTLEMLDDMASRISIPIIATLPAMTFRDALGRWQSRPAFSDAPARCVWSIAADPQDAQRRLLVSTRMTFTTPGPNLAFRIVDGRIAWEAFPELPCDLPIHEQDEAVEWLRSMLQEGEQRGSIVRHQASEFGLSAKMIRRARKTLKVKIRREGFAESSKTIWSLPQPPASDRPVSAVPQEANCA